MYALPYLPPANEVCEGNVFTGVCLSTGSLGLCPAGSLSGEGVSVQWLGLCPGGVPVQEDAPKVKSWPVRILLECILVSSTRLPYIHYVNVGENLTCLISSINIEPAHTQTMYSYVLGLSPFSTGFKSVIRKKLKRPRKTR